eukprot:symbB.v1.2.031451.t1/scaffold3651.1/size52678/4
MGFLPCLPWGMKRATPLARRFVPIEVSSQDAPKQLAFRRKGPGRPKVEPKRRSFQSVRCFQEGHGIGWEDHRRLGTLEYKNLRSSDRLKFAAFCLCDYCWNKQDSIVFLEINSS